MSGSQQSSGLQVGDIISEIDGNRPELIESWMPYYADSNDAPRQRDMARSLTRGDCGPLSGGPARKRNCD